jgi:hypothetical protein
MGSCGFAVGAAMIDSGRSSPGVNDGTFGSGAVVVELDAGGDVVNRDGDVVAMVSIEVEGCCRSSGLIGVEGTYCRLMM